MVTFRIAIDGDGDVEMLDNRPHIRDLKTAFERLRRLLPLEEQNKELPPGNQGGGSYGYGSYMFCVS